MIPSRKFTTSMYVLSVCGYTRKVAFGTYMDGVVLYSLSRRFHCTANSLGRSGSHYHKSTTKLWPATEDVWQVDTTRHGIYHLCGGCSHSDVCIYYLVKVC